MQREDEFWELEGSLSGRLVLKVPPANIPSFRDELKTHQSSVVMQIVAHSILESIHAWLPGALVQMQNFYLRIPGLVSACQPLELIHLGHPANITRHIPSRHTNSKS